MVEHNLAKVGVASSSLVFRSLSSCWLFSLRRRAFLYMYHADVRRPLYYGGIAQGESLACLPDSNYSQSKKKKKQSPQADKARTTSGGRLSPCVSPRVCPLPLVLGSCLVIERSGMGRGRGVSRHVPQCSYLYSEDIVYVCQIVMASVLTSHIPCLFLPALHSQPHGLHAVSLVQPVDGSHQGGALAAVGDRVK